MSRPYSDIAALLRTIHWTYAHQRILFMELLHTWNPAGGANKRPWSEERVRDTVQAAIAMGYVTAEDSLCGTQLELTKSGRAQLNMPHVAARSRAA